MREGFSPSLGHRASRSQTGAAIWQSIAALLTMSLVALQLFLGVGDASVGIGAVDGGAWIWDSVTSVLGFSNSSNGGALDPRVDLKAEGFSSELSVTALPGGGFQLVDPATGRVVELATDGATPQIDLGRRLAASAGLVSRQGAHSGYLVDEASGLVTPTSVSTGVAPPRPIQLAGPIQTVLDRHDVLWVLVPASGRLVMISDGATTQTRELSGLAPTASLAVTAVGGVVIDAAHGRAFTITGTSDAREIALGRRLAGSTLVTDRDVDGPFAWATIGGSKDLWRVPADGGAPTSFPLPVQPNDELGAPEPAPSGVWVPNYTRHEVIQVGTVGVVIGAPHPIPFADGSTVRFELTVGAEGSVYANAPDAEKFVMFDRHGVPHENDKQRDVPAIIPGLLDDTGGLDTDEEDPFPTTTAAPTTTVPITLPDLTTTAAPPTTEPPPTTETPPTTGPVPPEPTSTTSAPPDTSITDPTLPRPIIDPTTPSSLVPDTTGPLPTSPTSIPTPSVVPNPSTSGTGPTTSGRPVTTVPLTTITPTTQPVTTQPPVTTTTPPTTTTTSTTLPPATRPPAVPLVGFVANTNSTRVTWIVGSDTGGGPLTGVDFEVQVGGAALQTVHQVDNTGTFVVPNYSGNDIAQVAVRGRSTNGFGPSVWSSWAVSPVQATQNGCLTPRQPVTTVSNPTLNPDGETFSYTVSASNPAGCPATAWTINGVPGTQRSWTFSAQPERTSFSYVVVPSNQWGVGPAAVAAPVTTPARPGRPVHAVDTTGHGVDLGACWQGFDDNNCTFNLGAGGWVRQEFIATGPFLHSVVAEVCDATGGVRMTLESSPGVAVGGETHGAVRASNMSSGCNTTWVFSGATSLIVGARYTIEFYGMGANLLAYMNNNDWYPGNGTYRSGGGGTPNPCSGAANSCGDGRDLRLRIDVLDR